MNNVLICCMGDASNIDFSNVLGGDYNPIIFADADYFHGDNDLVQKIDYKNEESLVSSILKVIPVSDVIIISKLNASESESFQAELDELIRKIFVSVKSMYAPLMRQRKGNVWVMEPQIDIQEGANFHAEPMIAGVKTGVKSLTKLAALELARKNVKFNYLCGEAKIDKIKGILEWANKQQNIYLTAQEITTL